MTETMELVVGWTLVGAFIFTVIITCLSVVGWVRFADRSQQKKLFASLIIEIVLGVGTSALDVSRFDPRAVRGELIDRGNNRAILDLLAEAIAPRLDREVQLTKKQAAQLVEKFRVERNPELKPFERDFRNKVRALPEGRLSREAILELRSLIDRPTIRAFRDRSGA